MPARQVQKDERNYKIMKLFLYIKLFYVDLKLKRLNKTLNKLKKEYNQRYLSL